jgi:hypothetical protein
MDSTLEAPVAGVAVAAGAESQVTDGPDEDRLAQIAEELREAIRRKLAPRE